MDKQDRLLWTPASNSQFSVKSAYLTDNNSHFLGVPNVSKAYWNKIWSSSSILPRHKLLWWKLLIDSLPTREHLSVCFNIDNLSCPVCHSDFENILHLFLFCDLARRMWFASPWNLRLDSQELVMQSVLLMLWIGVIARITWLLILFWITA
ncbi:hypothetical protein UlMin_017624 [Ulmus minor]